MSTKDDRSGSFFFVNKSTTSRTLSRSKAKERAEIFRHVQRVRQKHEGQRQRPAAHVEVQLEAFETCWALPNAKPDEALGEHEARTRKGNSTSNITHVEGNLNGQPAPASQSSFAKGEVAVGGTPDFAVAKWQHPAVQRLTGDGFDPFESFPKMAQYLPATENCPHPVTSVRSHLFNYVQSLDVTELARKKMLSYGLTKPTVMFSHMMMVIIENEFANEQLARYLDCCVGVAALRHVRREVQNLQDKCPWGLICLVNIFMMRAHAVGRPDIAAAHRGGLIAMLERGGGLRQYAAANELAQAGANGLIFGELLASAIMGTPLHPVLGDVTAGGNFSKYMEETAPVSPLNCRDGDFSELENSPHSRPEIIQLLQSIRLLIQSVTNSSSHLQHRMNPAGDYCRARKVILGSYGIVSHKETHDYIYESSYLTGILLLNAIEDHVPLHSCAANFPVVYQVEQLLKSQKPSASWGAFKGVYLNVILVAYLSSLATSSFVYFSGLLSHSLGYYACGVWEGAYRPLVTLKQFQDYCRSESPIVCVKPL